MLLNMLFTLLYHHLQMTKICQQLNTDKEQFHYWILHCDYWHRTSQAKRQNPAVNKIQKNFILWHQWYGKHLWAPAGLNSTTWGGIKHSNSSSPFQMKQKKNMFGLFIPQSILNTSYSSWIRNDFFGKSQFSSWMGLLRLKLVHLSKILLWWPA